MSSLVESVDMTTEIRMESSSDEKFTFIWRISNYPMIFKDMCADFTTKCGSKWKMQLEIIDGPSYAVKLCRCFEGDPVIVTSRCVITAGGPIYSSFNLKTQEFSEQESVWTLFEFPASDCTSDEKSEHSEEDVLEIFCSMMINDVTVTNTAKSLAFDLGNFLENQEHCDMMISVGKISIPVHRSIVCARSPVLDKMYQHGLMESTNPVIEMNDIDLGTVKDFAYFLYSGKVIELYADTAMKLYSVAEKYGVLDLQNACSKYLEFNMEFGEACDVLILAHRYKDDNLKEAAKFYIRIHASYVKTTEEWINLVKTNPKLAVEVFKY